jgi:signal transduction histidine kinase
MLGWLSILESGKPIREVHSALAVISRNAQLQARLIDDLLDMNRLMSGKVSVERVDVDIAALVQATMQSLQPMAQGKGVQLLAVVESDSGQLPADARRLQQVLWNIVHNAVKFTAKGGRVELRVQRLEKLVQISVQDNGKGISPAFLPHVFERFRQEDSTPTREFFGLGLGLAIARQLIELHGGTVEASSAGEGRGSTFIIRLPTHVVVEATPIDRIIDGGLTVSASRPAGATALS